MKRCTPVALVLGLVGAPSNAGAQGTATYSLAFGSPGGPSVWYGISPGQTLSVFVNVTISPGVGAPIGMPAAPVWGLADGAFGIVSNTGSFSNISLDPPYNFPAGTSAGVVMGSSVNGIAWGAGLLQWPHPSPSTTDTVWSATFTAGANPSAVFNFTGPGQTGVYFGDPGGVPSVALYNSIGTTGTIIHIPCPAGTLVVVSGLAGLYRPGRLRDGSHGARPSA
jgi:hypothetical protein